jgi:predicted nucleotidyltransferase
MDWKWEHNDLMAHFAKLNENNVVIDVNTVNNDVLDPNDEENSGIAFLTVWSNGYTNWKQTSYNKKIRKNYASIGYIYDEVRDAFIPPEPINHIGFDEETCQWIVPNPNEA